MILDGFGEGKDYPGNAITHAKMPNLNRLRKEYPVALLQAHGEAVGLPAGTQGGSEVGHFTMGAGRIVFQKLEEINRSIKDKSFFQKKPLLKALNKVQKTPKSTLHLLGMISDQGVHSHLNHLFALLEMAKKAKVGPVYIHAITDGRDVPERTAGKFIKQIQAKIHELKMDQPFKTTNGDKLQFQAKIATIIGRYYAMDRDNNWDRTQKAYDLYTSGKGIKETNPIKAIKNSYASGIKTDYYIEPILLDENGLIKPKDSVIFWNFRTDRTRQITQCFTGEVKIGFKPAKTVHPFFVCFGDYSNIAPVVYSTKAVKNNLGNVLSQHKIHQLRIAETEKYAHVTYFFNSQVEKPFALEDRILIDSPKTPSYAQKPAMSAPAIADRAVQEIKKNKHQVIIQNFANADLVGHSGDYKATVKALEAIDKCIGEIVPAALANGYDFILTADHGNAEYMIYPNGDPCPSHTTNPVICLVAKSQSSLAAETKNKYSLSKKGGLEDIAPTMLDLLNIKKPKEMTGQSLITN